MPRLVVKNNITAGGALTVGQTIHLGSFIMTAHSAAAPTMTSRVIKSNLHVSEELVEKLDPMELSSVNGLLDRITALVLSARPGQLGQRTTSIGHALYAQNNDSST